MPGIAASTSDTWEFGSPPNAVEAPENNLACEVTWACTSRPITTSQSPVAPLISFDFLAGASIANSRPFLCARSPPARFAIYTDEKPSREVLMKRLLAAAIVLFSPVAIAQQAAQQTAPLIPYDSVPNFLKLPTELNMGEAAGVP